MKHIKKLALIALFIVTVAVTCPGPYNIYVYRESGGTGGGPWFQYSGTASSLMGGNIAVTLNGTLMLDNRVSSPSTATTIYYNPPSNGCDRDPSLCREEF